MRFEAFTARYSLWQSPEQHVGPNVDSRLAHEKNFALIGDGAADNREWFSSKSDAANLRQLRRAAEFRLIAPQRRRAGRQRHDRRR